jgi:hypothetical protein
MVGYESLTFAILTGSLPDADATFTVLVEDGDVSNLSDSAAVARRAARRYRGARVVPLLGRQQVLQGRLQRRQAVRCRLTITPAANTSASLLAAVAMLGHPHATPTQNPPV